MPADTLQGRISLGMARAAIPTPAALARKMGVIRQTVHRWVSGEGTNPEPEMLIKLADALNLSIRWLATGDGPMSPGETISVAEAEVLAIYRTLGHFPKAAETWVSHGRNMVELLSPASTENPFGPRRR